MVKIVSQIDTATTSEVGTIRINSHPIGFFVSATCANPNYWVKLYYYIAVNDSDVVLGIVNYDNTNVKNTEVTVETLWLVKA